MNKMSKFTNVWNGVRKAECMGGLAKVGLGNLQVSGKPDRPLLNSK